MPITRTASIRARSFVDLLSLSKTDFEEVRFRIFISHSALLSTSIVLKIFASDDACFVDRDSSPIKVWKLYPGIYSKIVAKAKLQWEKAMKVLGGPQQKGGKGRGGNNAEAEPGAASHKQNRRISAVAEDDVSLKCWFAVPDRCC